MQKIKSSKYAVLYPIVFFLSTNMLVRSWVPMFYGSWRTLLFGCIVSLFIVPHFLRRRWFFWIAAYSVVISINWYLGDKLFDNASVVTNEVANMFLFCSAIYYMICSNDTKCLKWTYWTLLIMVGVAAIGSLVVNQISPEIVRNQDEIIKQNNEDILIGYYRMGLSNYLLPHGLPAIIPPLVLLIKRAKTQKWLRLSAIGFLSLTLILTFLGGSTTVLLLSVIGLATIFMRSNTRKNKAIIIIPVIFLAPFVVFPELAVDIVGLLSGDVAQTYSSHLRDLADYSSKGTSGNMSSRMDLYSMSLGEFFKNPLWGTSSIMSDHSVLLDRLGTLGLLGFIPLIAIITAFIRFVRNRLDDVGKLYFDTSVMVMIIMLVSKGIEEKEIWLMFFVGAPVIFYIAGAFKTKKIEIK